MESSEQTTASEIEKSSLPTNGSAELENTGERFLPGEMYSAEMAYDHLTRYRLAERYVEDKEVLDMGCGAGYGTHSLSRLASNILGVDLSGEAVTHAANRYQKPNLRYEGGDVTSLPFEEGSFEAAISFEVIEHLENPEDLVLEAKRLLKEDGVFIVSTPDKQTYSNNRSLVNRHHLSEMYPLEFREILEKSFEHVQIYRQGALAGSLIVPEVATLSREGAAEVESTQFSLTEPVFGDEVPSTFYMVAVCTNGPAPEPLDRPLLILDRDRQIYEEADDREAKLRHVRMYHDYRHQTANQRLGKANARLRQARQQVRDMQGSRVWRVATGLKAVAGKIRGILRRG